MKKLYIIGGPMVIENICCILNQFLNCSVYDHVIFCWVMDRQEIIDVIISKLDTLNIEMKVISLVCSPETLKTRLKTDIENGTRTVDVIKRSLSKLPQYYNLHTEKIMTDDRNVEDIVEKIVENNEM